MTPSRVSGHFIDGRRGPLFALLRQPKTGAKGGVLVVPPFAEEMNKCRRMVTLVAERLANNGIATIVPDLYGTGDSGGEFSDGDWNLWQDDLRCVADWVTTEHRISLTGLLAIRLGAALAAQDGVHGALPNGLRTVLWQPVFDGSRYLTQFLRLRIAASLMEEDRKESLGELRARAAAGESLTVAGYDLSPALVAALDRLAVPAVLPGNWRPAVWLEAVREASAELPLPATQLANKFRAAGSELQIAAMVGEPFWAATEIVVNENWVATTAEALSA